MSKSPRPRTFTTILGFAAMTAAAGLTLGLPQTTHADHDDLAMWVAPGTKVGPTVIAEGRLVRDAKAKSGWALEIRAHNPGKSPEVCDVVAMVSELEGMPMARVAPPPRIVWQQRQTFTVQPGAEQTRHVAVPATLARKLDAQAPPPPPAPSAGHAAPPRQAEQRAARPAQKNQGSVPRVRPSLAFSSLSVRLHSAS